MTGGEMEIRPTTGRIPFEREEDEIQSKTGDFRLRKNEKKKNYEKLHILIENYFSDHHILQQHFEMNAKSVYFERELL